MTILYSVIYNEWSFGDYLSPLFCDMRLDGRTECFWVMNWCYGILFTKMKNEIIENNETKIISTIFRSWYKSDWNHFSIRMKNWQNKHYEVLCYTIYLPTFKKSYIYMNTVYRTLWFDNKHLLVQTIQRCDHNNKIKMSRPYHLPVWLNIATDMNKVTINSQFIKVDLTNLVLQTSRIHQMVIWCLPITFGFWYEVRW